MRDLLASWNGGRAPRELGGAHFDLAVAKGAAHYAALLVKGEGIRIRAGSARSYYLGVESSMPAVPGLKPPVNDINETKEFYEMGGK